MKKYFLFALLAMFLVGCGGPNVNNSSGGDSNDDGGGSNKSYVVTGEATDLTHKSVVLLGWVNVEIADYETIEWGVMYSADKDELESRNGAMVVCDDALIENAYRVELSDLAPETKYYYCAFVYVNNQDFKYGSVKSFTTLAAPKIDGIGVFSVSNSKLVTFSKGNLQYTQSTNTWSFASAQWDYIGTDNVTGGSVSFDPTYGDSKEGTALADKVDLFGWSTSATHFGVSTSTYYYDDYYGSFVDWGTNKIGSDAPNTWRTLTSNEWEYLLNNRPNASSLKGVAQVNGVNGLILLPDNWNWTCPSGVTFKSGFHNNYGVEYYAAYQTFTTDQWSKLEAAGAVFLPAAGGRGGSNVNRVQNSSDYWSATEGSSNRVYGLYFYSDEANMMRDYRYGGHSVRLVKDFTTLAASGVDEITILTGSAEDITYNSVVLYGELEANMSDYTSVQYGISYSTNRNDLQSDNSTLVYCSESLQDNSYSVALSGLEAETKYYYCAFVYVNNQDFKFGTVKNFTTLEAPKIDGIGMFSVSADKQVTFSKGNLQYTQSTNTWSFASAQWEMIGTDNVTGGSVSFDPTYGDSKEGTALADKVDLFGWSTAITNFGVSSSTPIYNYIGSFVDWGTNKIGSDAPNTWRTLTYDEWKYLLNTRPNASSLKGVAQVNGVNGLILLPDSWTCPSGVTFESGFHSSYRGGVDYYAVYQTFTAAEWSKLEAAGAVFLPASGRRLGSIVGNVQYAGYYWSAREGGSYYANYLGFYSVVADMYNGDRDYGRSVRLVNDL